MVEDSAHKEGFEFSRADFPENTNCKVMPSMDPNFREVEIIDVRGEDAVIEVPAAAVIPMNIGRLLSGMAGDQLPKTITKQLSEDVGTGLLACRVVESLENRGVAIIEIPTSMGPMRLEIPRDKIARRL